MKKIIYFTFIVLILSACEKTKTDNPQILSFTADAYDLNPGIKVHFTAKCKSDKAAIWFGDKYYGDPENSKKLSDYDSLQKLIANPNTKRNATYNYPEGKALTPNQISGIETIDYIYTDSLSPKTYNKYKDLDKIKVVLIVTNVGDYGKTIKTDKKELILTMHKP